MRSEPEEHENKATRHKKVHSQTCIIGDVKHFSNFPVGPTPPPSQKNSVLVWMMMISHSYQWVTFIDTSVSWAAFLKSIKHKLITETIGGNG